MERNFDRFARSAAQVKGGRLMRYRRVSRGAGQQRTSDGAADLRIRSQNRALKNGLRIFRHEYLANQFYRHSTLTEEGVVKLL